MSSEILSDEQANCLVRENRCVVHGVTAPQADEVAEAIATEAREREMASREREVTLRKRVADLELELHQVRLELESARREAAANAQLAPVVELRAPLTVVSADVPEPQSPIQPQTAPAQPQTAPAPEPAEHAVTSITYDGASPSDGDEAPSDEWAIDPSSAWDDGEASFEERIAARAFFHSDPEDEAARRWFLDKS